MQYERPFSIPFTSACNHTNSFSQHSLLKTDLLVLGRGGHNLAFPVPCSSEKGLQWVRVIRWIGVCLSNYGVNYWSILSTIERQRAIFQCGMVHLRLALVIGMPDLRAVKEGAWLYGENE